MSIYSIPPDISYGLQCSVEGMDITEDVMTFYYRFNQFTDLAALVDNDERRDSNMSIRESLRSSARRLYIRPYNDWFYTKAETDQKTWCVASATSSFNQKAAEMIDYHITKYISDALENGLDPMARRYQEDWLDRDSGFIHNEKVAAQLAHKINTLPMDDLLHAIRSPDDFNLRIPQPERTIWEVEGFSDTRPWTDDGAEVRPRPRAEKKRQRKVLAKSAQFMRSLVGAEQTKLFIGGDRVEIEGQRFTFSVKVNRIHATDHGALNIQVKERHSGDHLCNLCWYVEKTPAVDQISAMILAVQSGDEDMILKIGNALSVQHDALTRHPHVHDVIKFPSRFVDFFDLEGDPDERDDRTLHLTLGTHKFWRNNPSLYLDFARRCSARIMRHFPQEALPYYRPINPKAIRHFLPDGTISRDLLQFPQEPLTPQLVQEVTEVFALAS